MPGRLKELDPAVVVAAAKAALDGMIADDAEPVELPDGMGHYRPVAVFSSETVAQSTGNWGDLKITFGVPRTEKYQALPATDYPGCRLYVVVYAPDDNVDDDTGGV